MLHDTRRCRFAPQPPPFRERRLLFVDPQDRNRPQDLAATPQNTQDQLDVRDREFLELTGGTDLSPDLLHTMGRSREQLLSSGGLDAEYLKDIVASRSVVNILIEDDRIAGQEIRRNIEDEMCAEDKTRKPPLPIPEIVAYLDAHTETQRLARTMALTLLQKDPQRLLLLTEALQRDVAYSNGLAQSLGQADVDPDAYADVETKRKLLENRDVLRELQKIDLNQHFIRTQNETATADVHDVSSWFSQRSLDQILQELHLPDETIREIQELRQAQGDTSAKHSFVNRLCTVLSNAAKNVANGAGLWRKSEGDKNRSGIVATEDDDRAKKTYIEDITETLTLAKEELRRTIDQQATEILEQQKTELELRLAQAGITNELPDLQKEEEFKKTYGVSLEAYLIAYGDMVAQCQLAHPADLPRLQALARESIPIGCEEPDKYRALVDNRFSDLQQRALPRPDDAQFLGRARQMLGELRRLANRDLLRETTEVRRQRDIDTTKLRTNGRKAADRMKGEDGALVRDVFGTDGAALLQELPKLDSELERDALDASENTRRASTLTTLLGRENALHDAGIDTINVNAAPTTDGLDASEIRKLNTALLQQKQDSANVDRKAEPRIDFTFNHPFAKEVQRLHTTLQTEVRPALNVLDNVPVCRFIQTDEGSLAEKIQRECAKSGGALEEIAYALNHGQTEQARTRLAQQQNIVGKLQKIAAFVKNGVPRYDERPPRYTTYDDPGSSANGTFDADKGIRVNLAKCRKPGSDEIDEEKFNKVLEHEFGHAVLHTLTSRRETAILPYLFEETEKHLNLPQDMNRLLQRAMEKWGITQQRQTLIDNELRRKNLDPATIDNTSAPYKKAAEAAEKTLRTMAMEELFNTFASQGTDVDPDLKPLFEHLEETINGSQGTADDPARTLSAPPKEIAPVFQMTEDDLADAMGAQPKPAPKTQVDSAPSVVNIEGDLRTIGDDIESIRNYKKVPEYPVVDGLDAFISNADAWHAKLTAVNRKKDTEFQIEDPENDPRFKQALQILKEEVEAQKTALEKIRQTYRNESIGGKTQRSFWSRFRGSFNMMSINDIVSMVKDGWEDLTRMWKRRSEKNRNVLGKALTDWIPKGIPYAGRLQYEYHRRQQTSELDEVGQWEKALENVDSNTLRDSYESVSDPDRLKATTNLLTKRGRMDWNDVSFWKALMRFTSLPLPIEQCKQDRQTRDHWLHQLVSDIWGDKDLWYQWQTSNNNNFTSERDKHKPRSHVLSNTRQLGTELNYQLQKYVECGGGKTSPLPERVNPHTYESALHYAMVNGKMSMADKFYYLVRGISVGLIPHERLEILNGEILREFPFIDYFSSQNNARWQIDQLAKALTEDNDEYKPGPKTNVWLQFVLARDERTRQRAVKILSRSGNTIDHEDIPMLVSILDHGDVSELLSEINSGLKRVTPEGLKNGYVGYFEFMEMYARLAQLDETGTVRFTDKDARDFVARLVAFLHYDNIVTGNASSSGRPPATLSRSKIESESMPSAKDGTTSKSYRDPSLNLAEELIVNQFGIRSLPAEISGKAGTKDVPITDYLGNLRERSGRWQSQIAPDQMFYATQALEKQLFAAVASEGGRKSLLKSLAQYGRSLDSDPRLQSISDTNPDKVANTFKSFNLLGRS